MKAKSVVVIQNSLWHMSFLQLRYWVKINTLNELKKLINLCRKEGVSIIKVDGIELVLSEKPTTYTNTRKNTQTYPETTIETPDALTPEELLFYSATGQTVPVTDGN